MLRLTEVHTFYGNVHALKGTSLSLEEGEIVSLIGANGAGKTTMLRSIVGLAKISSGIIEYQGEKITGLSPGHIVKKGLSLCPQGWRIWRDMTVLENVEMGAYLRRGKSAIRNDMDLVFSLFPILRERRLQLAGTLSGGEQQMLAIGRVLMSRPKTILFDEPSLGLSPMVIEKISEIIKDIHERGVAVLLVEQNAFLALTMSNRAYVLETGRIVLEGKAQELLSNEAVKKAYLGG
jgi:branched-chain amino acid transport system ATP-binding protein